MKKAIYTGTALACIVLAIYVMARGFGMDPHAVPFLLSGKPAPDFRMKRLESDAQVSLSQFKGKPLVINFWATWCKPCALEHPVLEWAAQKYGDRAIFLGIVFEDSKANAKRFLSQHGSRFIHLFDRQSTVAVDYGVSGVPETYFIDRNGIIHHKVTSPFVRIEDFTAHIESILQ